MRLIDADALIESLTINPTECIGCPEPEWIDELIQILDTAPSVLINCIQCKNYYETEDDNGVMGHLLCKDCKWWQDSEVGVVECPICTRIHDMVFEMGAYDYCSKGKRRGKSEVKE